MTDGADLLPSRVTRWLTPGRVAALLWIAISVVLIVTRWPAIARLDLSDTDDAMRMAQVRDLIAGQGWWDLMQYRVNPAGGGVPMHWSRIVDAPLAAGILLLKPMVGQAMAERIVMALWPPLLGCALSVACVLGYRRLSDLRIAYVAPVVLICCGYIVFQFQPLHVDHHGWQILLAMLIMGQALRPSSWQAGALGGFFAAILLAVSIEGLPIVALFAAIAALRWMLNGRIGDRDRMAGYLLALAGGAALVQFLTRGPLGLSGGWCDSLSAPYLSAFAVVALVVAAAANLVPARPWARISLLGAAAVLAVGTLLWVGPQCARGPFASLDPIVVQYWYMKILEGQPIWYSPPLDAVYALLPSLIGFGGALLAWRQSQTTDARRNWTTVLIAQVGAAALSVFLLRSVATAHLFAIPGCAFLAIAAWRRARAIRSPLARIVASVLVPLILPLFASVAAASLIGWAFPGLRPVPAPAEARASCLDTRAIAALNRLAPTTVLTPIDFGAPLIFWTRHSVVATGHHRNKEAMADTIRAFISDPAVAEPLVRKQKATLVVFCRAATDFGTYRRANAAGLAAVLYTGHPPAWLEPVPLGANAQLSVWRVRPAR